MSLPSKAILLGLALGCVTGANAAEAKQQLVLAIGGEPEQGFDPLLGWGQYGNPLFQSTLLSRGRDLSPQPQVATDWSLSEDRLTWTLTLRDDIRFADGTRLTADDVAFTFNAAAEAGGRADLSALESAEAIDSQTVTLTLREPRITFIDQLMTLGIVPSAARDNGYDDNYGRDPLGSGPYRLVEWQEGEQLIVERNPHFYGPTPPFERLVFLFTGEDTTLNAVRAGEVDLAALPPALANRLPSHMRRVVMESVDNRGILFPMQPDNGETADNGAPIGNDVTADIAIRQAINLALDRDTLVDVALEGYGRPAFGPADGLPWSDSDETLDAPDLERAAALLDNAGWHQSDDNLREKDGQPARFKLTYPAGDTTRQRLAEISAQMVRPLGIEMQPTARHWDEIQRKALHQDAVVMGFGSHSPQEIYYLYHSQHSGNGFYNSGFYANPSVDDHLGDAQQAASAEQAAEHWQAAQWDGDTGYGVRGEATWAWMVNLEHVYTADRCLDLGTLGVAPHGHGWPVTANLLDWRWTCD
ncbi:ABC transporter substrate-binding protein [Halomonas sp. HL-93]|uniref:ABC transporter substrate-binding protein n=1 Tax=Halomonas sp. HL-93 TaxID=1666906 RepID=UPI0006DA17C6|nr:ABC transporter substrate-binding protein [Halomonas sp. HL-93]KPQ21440.1 MAG: ABC-type nickel uptake system substrate-binding component NikA [Halomonas sp. HL-93]SBR50129.1 peptide/nickel transport system substrate-binding protein [Halomonas sp. HL-93]